MKLVCLNTWAGHEYNALMRFIGGHMADTDIFCFQEMTVSEDAPRFSKGHRTELMEDIKRLLGGFRHRYEQTDKGFVDFGEVDFDNAWGQTTHARKEIEILDSGVLELYAGDVVSGEKSNPRAVMQHTKLRVQGGVLVVCNVHGTIRPGTKLDTPVRLEQSKRIKAFLSDIDDPVILCGDFNLLPKTESIRMLGEGMENLIKTHKIKTTRGSLNPYIGTPQHQEFADYMFVSKGVAVEGFSVPDARVSDHLPMILTFAL